MRNSIFVLSFLICRIILWKSVRSDWFGGLISLPSVFAFSESFQRLQCLRSFTFTRLQCFQSFTFNRLQCLLSFTFQKTLMSSVFYIYKTSMSSAFYISKDFNVLSLLHLQDFNVFCLLHFQRLQCVQFCFTRLQRLLLDAFDTSMSMLVCFFQVSLPLFSLTSGQIARSLKWN